jgi:hypothetical protein
MTIAPTAAIRRVEPGIGARVINCPVGQAKGLFPMESTHVSALQLKHAGIERQLQAELNRPLPDLAFVQTLKKRKLRIKEELTDA